MRFSPRLSRRSEAMINNRPDPIQRITLSSSVSQRFVLDSPAYQVNTAVGQPDHMERVGHLIGVGQRPVIGPPGRGLTCPTLPTEFPHTTLVVGS